MKYQAFGKVSTSSGGSQNKVLASLYSKRAKSKNSEEKENLEDEIAKETLRQKSDYLAKEVYKLKELLPGRSARVFKVRQAIMGSKKQGQEQQIMKDFQTGDILVDSKEIKTML